MRRAGAADLGRRPCRRCSAWTGERQGAGGRSRHAVDIRAAQGRIGRHHSRLHRTARRRWTACARGSPYPVLRLTSAGALLLKEGGGCVLYRAVEPPKAKSKRRGEGAATFGIDADLFEVLRGVRLRLARARGVPPYVIFTTRPSATWPTAAPPRSTIFTMSTASARERRPTSAMRFSTLSARFDVRSSACAQRRVKNLGSCGASGPCRARGVRTGQSRRRSDRRPP